MANPTLPPDQPPPSISAAELRRRLLASTPPPIAATASTPDPVEAADGEEPAQPGSGSWNGTNDLLARLKMPGKSGAVPVPTSRPAPTPVPLVPEPLSNRTPVNRRTPPPNAGRLYGDSSSAIAGALSHLNDLSNGSGRYESPLDEVQRLKAENKELRTHLGAIEEQIAKGELAPPPPVPKTRTELEEWGDELEKESAKLTQDKKRLDDDRRQLREDEEALEKQMRDMEVSMARERAMLARQETELKRLSAEIQHELEILQRGDAGLREQMAKFQRRAQEVMTKPPGGRR